MKDVEFLKYQPVLDDPYMDGLATIRIAGKYVVRYKMAKNKDGGNFISPATFQFNADGKKTYLKGFMLDSQSDSEMLEDFIRAGIKAHFNRSQVSQASNISTGAAADEPLPF